MSRRFIFRSFDPFDARFGQSEVWYAKVQELVYYAESRFRVIVLNIANAREEHLKWMQTILSHELFTILSYIGSVQVVGQVLDIPFAIRSLASSLASIKEDLFPGAFDSEFIQAIENGYGLTSTLVRKHHLAWWGQKKKIPVQGEYMDSTNAFTCLTHYLEHIGDGNPRLRCFKNPALLRELYIKYPTYDDDPADTAACAVVAHAQSLPSPSSSTLLHKVVAEHCVSEFEHLLLQANAYQAKFQAEVDRSDRRAAGFLALFEAVTIKETADTPDPPRHVTEQDKRKVMTRVRTEASRNLKAAKAATSARGKEPENPKWAPGVVLTTDDVLNLGHRKYQIDKTGYHSGYTNTFNTGSYSYSHHPSEIDSAAPVETVSNTSLPENTIDTLYERILRSEDEELDDTDSEKAEQASSPTDSEMPETATSPGTRTIPKVPDPFGMLKGPSTALTPIPSDPFAMLVDSPKPASSHLANPFDILDDTPPPALPAPSVDPFAILEDTVAPPSLPFTILDGTALPTHPVTAGDPFALLEDAAPAVIAASTVDPFDFLADAAPAQSDGPFSILDDVAPAVGAAPAVHGVPPDPFDILADAPSSTLPAQGDDPFAILEDVIQVPAAASSHDDPFDILADTAPFVKDPLEILHDTASVFAPALPVDPFTIFDDAVLPDPPVSAGPSQIPPTTR
ncbi:hypothetical protein D9613_012875 [Agrocybe pediades]|uniref:Uncharacterized protein n=1 Tax=Agrocybe pediades TaxID=84607 RepID=A0A8H4VQ77_9AGAR|nr:hypothetical protein D9613_012875 [Agrocybe pediades]